MGIITNLLTVVQLLDRLLQCGSMAFGAQHVPAKLNPPPRVKMQMNGYDCGPFVCRFAEAVSLYGRDFRAATRHLLVKDAKSVRQELRALFPEGCYGSCFVVAENQSDVTLLDKTVSGWCGLGGTSSKPLPVPVSSNGHQPSDAATSCAVKPKRTRSSKRPRSSSQASINSSRHQESGTAMPGAAEHSRRAPSAVMSKFRQVSVKGPKAKIPRSSKAEAPAATPKRRKLAAGDKAAASQADQAQQASPICTLAASPVPSLN
jgi:hypothetical protein